MAERVNLGGNYCGHDPQAPQLNLALKKTRGNRPKMVRECQRRVEAYFASPFVLPELRTSNGSVKRRQQRSERREACIVVVKALIEYTDLSSLRCGIPTEQGFLSLTFEFLRRFTPLSLRRLQRAVRDLKAAGLITVSQPRQLQADGRWRGQAAVKAVSRRLFSALGLGKWLKHEMDRASRRLARKAAQAKGTLSRWARHAPVFGDQIGKRFSPLRKQAAGGIDEAAYQAARMELLVALKQTYPDRSAEALYAEAQRILKERFNAS